MTTDFAPISLKPFIPYNDHEGAAAFSRGFHNAGGNINPVRRIRFGYPLASWYETGEETTFELAGYPTTLEEAILKTFDLLRRCDEDGLLGAPHNIEDYCLEHITIDRRGTAFVEFGS